MSTVNLHTYILSGNVTSGALVINLQIIRPVDITLNILGPSTPGNAPLRTSGFGSTDDYVADLLTNSTGQLQATFSVGGVLTTPSSSSTSLYDPANILLQTSTPTTTSTGIQLFTILPTNITYPGLFKITWSGTMPSGAVFNFSERVTVDSVL